MPSSEADIKYLKFDRRILAQKKPSIMVTFQVYLLTALAQLAVSTTVRTSTPPMGWNSYNAYNCNPTEDIMKTNAQALVSSGLSKFGYTYVTTDCGWASSSRNQQGRLQWDTSKFPSGGKELGDFLHGLGLKFGVYSGAGYYQCGSTDVPASLGTHSWPWTTARSLTWPLVQAMRWLMPKPLPAGAETFSSKIQAFSRVNFVLTALGTTIAIQYHQQIWWTTTHKERYRRIASTQWPRPWTRPIATSYMKSVSGDVGQTWAFGMVNPKHWEQSYFSNRKIRAAADATTWRISNDISNNWASIWRITNQVVPYYEYTSPGRYPDMDMLMYVSSITI